MELHYIQNHARLNSIHLVWIAKGRQLSQFSFLLCCYICKLTFQTSKDPFSCNVRLSTLSLFFLASAARVVSASLSEDVTVSCTPLRAFLVVECLLANRAARPGIQFRNIKNGGGWATIWGITWSRILPVGSSTVWPWLRASITRHLHWWKLHQAWNPSQTNLLSVVYTMCILYVSIVYTWYIQCVMYLYSGRNWTY